MIIKTDLHIHSALSPCCDIDMTPNNIVNMSVLKKLDIIAITDHNSTKNLPAIINCAKDKDIIVICGMEIETIEEVHMIVLFKDLCSAERFGDVIYNRISHIENNPEIFGEQIIYDENDNIISVEKKLLLSAVDISIDELINIIPKYNGVVYPAHVDRGSYSIISNLGFIASDLDVKTVEISRGSNKDEVSKKYRLQDYNIITASDAHYLGDIFDNEGSLNLREKSIDALFDYILGVKDEE